MIGQSRKAGRKPPDADWIPPEEVPVNEAAPAEAVPVDKAEVGIGFAISREVVLGAGLTTVLQDLRFFAEAQRPSRDTAGVINFIQYFLDTAKASIHFVVKGIHLAHDPDVAEDIQPLLSALRSEGIRILSVETAPVASRRCPASAMPPAATSWPAEVTARAQVAIGAAATGTGAGPAEPDGEAGAQTKTGTPRVAVSRRTPKIRRSESVHETPAAIANAKEPKVDQPVSVTDESLDPEEAEAEVKKLRKRLRKRNREVAALQEQLLEKNRTLADLQQDLIQRSEMSTEGDLELLRRRLDEMTSDLDRARATAQQQRLRAGLHSMDLSRREIEAGLLTHDLASSRAVQESLEVRLEETELELLTSKSLHTITKDHAATIEKSLGVKTRSMSQLRAELRDLHEKIRTEQLQRVHHAARFDGFAEAVRTDATRAMRSVENDLEAWNAAIEELEVTNRRLQDELLNERRVSTQLQSELGDLRARLSDVRAQVVRTPQQTPRLQRHPSAVEEFEDSLAARLTLLRENDTQPAAGPDAAVAQHAIGSREAAIAQPAAPVRETTSAGW